MYDGTSWSFMLLGRCAETKSGVTTRRKFKLTCRCDVYCTGGTSDEHRDKMPAIRSQHPRLITVLCENCSCTTVLRHTRTPSNRHLLRVAAPVVIVRRNEARQNNVLRAPETHREATDQSILADADWCDTPVLHKT